MMIGVAGDESDLGVRGPGNRLNPRPNPAHRRPDPTRHRRPDPMRRRRPDPIASAPSEATIVGVVTEKSGLWCGVPGVRWAVAGSWCRRKRTQLLARETNPTPRTRNEPNRQGVKVGEREPRRGKSGQSNRFLGNLLPNGASFFLALSWRPCALAVGLGFHERSRPADSSWLAGRVDYNPLKPRCRYGLARGGPRTNQFVLGAGTERTDGTIRLAEPDDPPVADGAWR